MIVVLINSMPDTDLLCEVYQGLDDINLLINPTEEQLIQVLCANPTTERLLAMGHGTGWGLINEDFSGYILNRADADLLRSREVIGIWCHASDYAQAEGLHGFFTSMFISNVGESQIYGYNDYSNQDIFSEVTLFSKRLNKLLKDKTPLNEWVDILRSQADMSKDYVAFNYNGLYYKP